MDINTLTNTITGTFDDVLVRNPPYTGTYVPVTTLGGGGGGGGSYDDTALTNMINANTLSITAKANSADVYLKTATYSRSETNTLLDAKHPSVTMQDSAGVSHTGVTTIVGGTVSGSTLTLPSGGGSSYDDTTVRSLISGNTTAIGQRRLISDSYTKGTIDTYLLQKHQTITARAASTDYANMSVINVPDGSFSNGTSTIPRFDASSLTASVAANTSAITQRRTIADSYTTNVVNTLLLQKHPTLTMRAAGNVYTGVTVIDVGNGGSVANGVLTVDQFDASSLQSSVAANTTAITERRLISDSYNTGQ